MKNAASKHIPNIDIGQAYDRRYIDSEVHFEQIQNLAQFFGHDMPVHYHDRFYQIHVVMSGEIRLQLDNRTYQCEGRFCFSLRQPCLTASLFPPKQKGMC